MTEGDIVEQGQILAQMDETLFRSAYQELLEQQLSLLLEIERLKSERSPDLEFLPDPELVKKAPKYAASESELFQARRTKLTSSLESLESLHALRLKEVDLLRPMVEASAVPKIELFRAEIAAEEVAGRIAATVSEFEADRSLTYSERLVELRQVEEKIQNRADQLERTKIISPVKGIVNRVLATTKGGVLKPGEPLMEILPLEERLRIEGRVDPRDIGFVFPGMLAEVKLTAFDFSIYGTLTGKVSHVSADTVIDDTQRDPTPYYAVYVELDELKLNGPTDAVEIRPGMQAQIELQSGKKTVLQYLLKPLLKATDAMSER